jgi:hypothetical protein
MTSMVVLTPSYARDFALCADLHRSVLKYAPESVDHHLVVPRADVALFARLAGPRTHVHCEEDFLPRTYVRLPRLNYSINIRHPYPPVRGWIRQQVLKLAAAAKLQADVILLVDSDIEFIRPFDVKTFSRDGVVRFYRQANAVSDELPRHLLWHEAGRQLLGIPQSPPPYTDYVSSLLAWDGRLVQQTLDRVQETTGKSWATAIGQQLHFSEWTLYGLYLDEIAGSSATAFSSSDNLCLDYWDETPLRESTATAFMTGLRSTDVAVMISAKSRTPLSVRRSVLHSGPNS